MTLVLVFQVSNFLSYSHYKMKGPYEKKNWFRPGGHCHMNSQIMENVIQYYLHVYDSALRIYSQKKSEYRTANYLYCGRLEYKMQKWLWMTYLETILTRLRRHHTKLFNRETSCQIMLEAVLPTIFQGKLLKEGWFVAKKLLNDIVMSLHNDVITHF